MNEDKKYFKYWGKIKKQENGKWDYHLLSYHCLDVAAVGPDFNGALIQFLIGLLQTTCVPKGKSDWRG